MSCEPAGSGRAAAGGAPATGTGDAVISVERVSKRYQIYAKPRDRLKQALVGRWRTYYSPFYAVRDVSFEVRRGEAVGIVGRNGSGKSTLLQMIAGTLAPTEGRVVVRGRVAALLELGSGFDPEFTGRENVLLNGAILGLSRREMLERFDDIAAFADIGAFIDQPVKHYSSGMYARLAFAVAVSVRPDVLIVDEILAVGDLAFQQKCVAKMRTLLDSGVSLLYVSHAPDAVKSLCQKGLFLREGRTVCFAPAAEAVDRYISSLRSAVNEEARRLQPELAEPAPEGPEQLSEGGKIRYGSGQATIEAVRVLDAEGRSTEVLTFGESVTVEVLVRARVALANLDVHFHVRDSVGVDLFGTGTADEQCWLPRLEAGAGAVVRFRFLNNLRSGAYGVTVTLTRLPDRADAGGITLDHISGAAAFQVIGEPMRPVMYKFHQPVELSFEALPGPARAAVAPAAG
ncbi:MAG TPA: ABC transporter ATP-binding protein [Phycisphaerales bacterium]|nr:ABC transporter ATP-binding protein [Phycisphaerales bacterium]